MKVLPIIEDSINVRHIEEIVSVLRDGGIIVYPTDTVYAIGCDSQQSGNRKNMFSQGDEIGKDQPLDYMQ